MTFEKIAAMLADYKGIDASTISAESTFQELGFDSLDLAEMVMKMEDDFGLTIELDASVKTVGQLVETIGAAK